VKGEDGKTIKKKEARNLVGGKEWKITTNLLK